MYDKEDGGGVDGLGQGAEAHSPAGELVNELQQMAQRAGQAPVDEDISRTQALEDVL